MSISLNFDKLFITTTISFVEMTKYFFTIFINQLLNGILYNKNIIFVCLCVTRMKLEETLNFCILLAYKVETKKLFTS